MNKWIGPILVALITVLGGVYWYVNRAAHDEKSVISPSVANPADPQESDLSVEEFEDGIDAEGDANTFEMIDDMAQGKNSARRPSRSSHRGKNSPSDPDAQESLMEEGAPAPGISVETIDDDDGETFDDPSGGFDADDTSESPPKKPGIPVIKPKNPETISK